MWHFHDSPISGHQGVLKTKKRADQSSYYWPNFHRDISDYVKSCDICEEKKNPSKKKRHFMKSYVSGGRFERIAADLAGPFPKSGNGNMYILVVADYFSKYTEIYPLPNMEAETIADAVFRGWIKRYGCPYEIHTDQGSQFESQLFSQLCEILCISKTRTTAFHPRSDGMVERLNRTIKEMISKYVNLPQTNWDKYIDAISMAYNTSVHETTGLTPYRMVFGCEMTVPVSVLCDFSDFQTKDIKCYSDYVTKLCESLEKAHDLARETIRSSVSTQRKLYNKNIIEQNYEVGDVVRLYQPKQKKGTKLKLSRNWTGPWVIIKRLSNILYQIQHSKTSKPKIVHADNLKPFRTKKTTQSQLKTLVNTNAGNCEHQNVQEHDTVPVPKSHADKRSTDKQVAKTRKNKIKGPCRK